MSLFFDSFSPYIAWFWGYQQIPAALYMSLPTVSTKSPICSTPADYTLWVHFRGATLSKPLFPNSGIGV